MQVYDVFNHIMPQPQPMHVHNEADPTAKLSEYLRAVKYKPLADPVTFLYALASGERDTLHAILKWALSQLPVLQKRAMVGFYLSMPEVPPEFKSVHEIAARTAEIRTLQEDFKRLHQELDRSKGELPELDALRKQLLRRENERASLSTRIAKAKAKAEGCAPLR